MAARQITDQLVQEVADELRSRYSLDDGAMRALGERLAGVESLARHAETQNFAERSSVSTARRFTDSASNSPW